MLSRSICAPTCSCPACSNHHDVFGRVHELRSIHRPLLPFYFNHVAYRQSIVRLLHSMMKSGRAVATALCALGTTSAFTGPLAGSIRSVSRMLNLSRSVSDWTAVLCMQRSSTIVTELLSCTFTYSELDSLPFRSRDFHVEDLLRPSCPEFRLISFVLALQSPFFSPFVFSCLSQLVSHGKR